jgi:methylenetetrahydrofolate reductase (NADPH)
MIERPARTFRKDISKPESFVITLELVPGEQSQGRFVDTVMAIAEDALEDGRVSAVSITDNPGGIPSLSPDVLGRDIIRKGMDVIVHFTCRDQNRVGLESRALQLGHMGIRNILALTGDFSGEGFAGKGAPVFDLDSVSLLVMLKMMGEGTLALDDRENFFVGCAVSPFKQTEEEIFCQYAKMQKKVRASAGFIITQLGYDIRKFHELRCIQKEWNIGTPTLGSVYVLTPGAAKIMARGRIPGVVVTPELLKRVQREWQDKKGGHLAAVERSARLAVVLKGLGYKGAHFGGINHKFDTLGQILDRMEQIERQWRDFVPEFDFPQKDGFYRYARDPETGLCSTETNPSMSRISSAEKMLFGVYRELHRTFFSHDAAFSGLYRNLCARLEKRPFGYLFTKTLEDVSKKMLFSCRECGDCSLQHVAFFCPESQCPKHTRNGPCGGSRESRCEVYPDRHCVWFKAYKRWVAIGKPDKIYQGFIPPRNWELDRTSSWINFHLGKDHQGSPALTQPNNPET